MSRVWCALALVVAVLVTSRAQAEATFGLAIAIARENDARIVDDAWVDAQIDEANRLFSPLGVRVRWTIEKELGEPHGALHTRADRDALTPLTEPLAINVFLVRELEDVDEPGRFRMGVCWTGRGGKRFVVVARSAKPSVLAHELGHLFGNGHSKVVNNLMSYSRESGAAIFLDPRQSETIKQFAATFLSTGALRDVGPPIRFF